MKKPLLATLLMLGFAGTTFAADRTDFQVFQDVSDQVNNYVYFTIFDSVHASVDAGHVTLFGKVTMPYKALDIEKRVARVDGVKDVRNTIEVLPVSSFDDSLRLRIARALYAHPALSRYGVSRNPSIHVIVEHGRVTLDGVVENEMDRSIASLVARSFMTFKVTNELKTSEEMAQLLETL
jgi:hyperosmotically inducible protein